MQSLFDAGKNELIRFYFTCKKERASWDGFMALHIHFDHNETEMAENMRAIFESYLQDIECRIFRPSAHDLYCVCKARETSLVANAVQFIEYYCAWNTHTCASTWYSLATEAELFLGHLEDKWVRPEHFSPAAFDMARYIDEHKNIMRARRGNGRVLLVEDDAMTRWMVRTMLRDHCLLATASCAHQVYGLYHNWKPDLVLLDINLPDGHGDEVLQWIIEQDPSANVVMFSSQDDVDTMTNMLEDGAKGFIAKPFDHGKIQYYLNAFSGAESENRHVR